MPFDTSNTVPDSIFTLLSFTSYRTLDSSAPTRPDASTYVIPPPVFDFKSFINIFPTFKSYGPISKSLPTPSMIDAFWL